MILDRLRRETREEHKRIEAALDLLSPALNLDRYLQILKRFHGAMPPLERVMEERCPERYRSLWRGRQKAHRLQADLECFGVTTPASQAPAALLPQISSVFHWLGSFYVVEGSMLGGQVICRHLEKHFGWAEGRGYSYFRGYGEQMAERWRQVVRAMEGEDLEGNLVLEGAHQTFHYLYRSLCVGL
jgi:heme oxygenase